MQTITLYLYDDGTLDCHYLPEERGLTISFDPAATPAKLSALLPAALKAALVAKVAAEARATEAEAKEAEATAKVEAVSEQIATAAQLEAKDAIIQDLLAQIADKA